MRETILTLYSLYFVFVFAYACSNTIVAPEKLKLFDDGEVIKITTNFPPKENALNSIERRDLLSKPQRAFFVSGYLQKPNTVFEPAFSKFSETD